MKNHKISTTFILAAALALGLYIPALALETSVNASIDGSINVGDNSSVKSSSSVDLRSGDSNSSDQRKDSSSTKTEVNNENNSSTTVSETGIEHRSAIATFVNRLLSTANRDGGIGSEVRVIAQEQNDSSSTTVDAIAKVEARSGIMAFLFGTDYKNTGVIRSELAKTANTITRLSEIASSTSISAQTKIELNAEIKSLQDDQAKLDLFVKAHESQFSLFGWFVKLFNR